MENKSHMAGLLGGRGGLYGPDTIFQPRQGPHAGIRDMAVHELGYPRITNAGSVGDFPPRPAPSQEGFMDVFSDFCAHGTTIAKLCYSDKQHFANKALHTQRMARLTTNEILARNLNALMTRHEMVQTALSKRSGVGQTTISLYLNPDRRQPSKSGKIPSPKLTEVEALAGALGVSLPEILSPDMRVAPPVIVSAQAANDDEHAPIYLVDARASAGRGQIVMSEDATKTLMFRRDWLAKQGAKPSQTIAFPVKGSSMVDAHIVNGSVVLANRADTEPRPKKFYVVWIDGGLFVKELVRKADAWYARSHNVAKADENPDILIDDPNARVVGRAFWCGFGL